MATISTRLTNAGTLLVNGTIDEVTYNTSSPTITNLFYSSQDFSSNILWQKSISVTISNTSATLAPDGTTTAQLITVGGAGTYPYIRSYRSGSSGSVVPCTPGTTYTVSMFVKYINQQYVNIVNEDTWSGGMSTRFDILNGVKTAPSGNVAATTMTNVGNGWWRISATYVPVPAGITYWNPQPIRIGSFDATNYSGSQVYVWGAQLEASSSPSVYQGIAAAGTLVTPPWSVKTVPDTVYSTGNFDEVTYNSTAGISAIKNILTYSQQFATGWSLGNVTSTSNAGLAPDGSQTANKLTENTVNNRHILTLGRPVAAGALQSPYTFSAYAKADTRGNIQLAVKEYQSFVRQASAIFNVSTGTIGTTGGFNGATLLYSNIADVGGGWYRCSMTVNLGSTETQIGSEILMANSSSVSSYTGDGTSSIYVWGAQTEAGNVATVYQGVTTGNTLISPNFARREDRTGNMYVTNSYDEFTGAPVVDSSLLWWFDPAQPTSYVGTAQVRNLSNTAQTGTISGNVIYSSVDGGKFVFSDYLDTTNTISAGNIGYPASVNDPWTMEAWIYVPTGATWSINNNVGPLYIRGSYAGAHGLVRMQADNTVAVWLRGNTTALAYRTGVTTRDRWNQVVGVWTGGAGGNLQCYVNGTLTQASTTTQDDPLKSTNFYAIGAANTGLSNNSGAVFVGNISSTKLYNRALTADEVAQNFNALRRRYNI